MKARKWDIKARKWDMKGRVDATAEAYVRSASGRQAPERCRPTPRGQASATPRTSRSQASSNARSRQAL